MRLQETKEPGALGEVGKQCPIVARQPAIEGAVADAFEGMQQPQGDHLTGPEVGFSGCLGRPDRWSSTWQNKVVIKAMVVSIDSSVPGRVAHFRPAWRKCMTMTIGPSSTIAFVGL